MRQLKNTAKSETIEMVIIVTLASTENVFDSSFDIEEPDSKLIVLPPVNRWYLIDGRKPSCPVQPHLKEY